MCLSATDPIIRTATNSSVHFIAKSEAKDHLVDHHNRMPIKSAICDGLLWLALGGLNLEHANLFFFTDAASKLSSQYFSCFAGC